MKTTRTFITTNDTNITYEMDVNVPYKDQPRLWAVRIGMASVEANGYHAEPQMTYTFYVERSTLERLGMVGRKDTPKPAALELAEDEIRATLEKLLTLVGVYPESPHGDRND